MIAGGGFALGSAHFYLEFTLVLQSLLLRAGYANPAIFNIEYTLVPDGVYPTQLHEVVRGYEHVLSVMGGDASKICVAGDSAGGTLILSLLQVLGAQSRGHVPEQGLDSEKQMLAAREASLLPTAQLDPRYNGHTGTSSAAAPLPLPGMVTLISPWITLMSNALFSSSGADFLDPRTLRLYAREYAGEAGARSHPASPGCCLDEGLWKAASPQRGYFVIYGEDEVFASDIENFVKVQGGLGIEITAEMIEARVHAWPVASLFASSTEEARLGGLRSIVSQIRERIR